MNTLYKSCLVLSAIGCLNWGLVGLFNFNLVEYLFGDGALLTRIIYVLVMVAGLIQLVLLSKDLDNDH
ncbi:MAG: DUF378 domain-containing protein [Bacilli bacterium]|nr:DUF378 domain-containing protein [Bacilli bacterium]